MPKKQGYCRGGVRPMGGSNTTHIRGGERKGSGANTDHNRGGKMSFNSKMKKTY